MEDAVYPPYPVSDPTYGEYELAKRVVSANMIIAYNMAYYRKAAGLTQEQLGRMLGGWNKVAVSAAERSWDGRRVRKFDADEIFRIARVLRLPVAALFLPPEDDGEHERYVIEDMSYAPVTAMRTLLEYAMSEPTEDEGDPHALMRVYERRLVAAVNKYLPSGVAEAVATRLKERATEEQLLAALREARLSRDALETFAEALTGLFSDNDLLQKSLAAMLEATPEGQALMERENQGPDEISDENRRMAWDNLAPEHREWQSHLAAIGTELFGERGPATRGEVDQVMAEARRRGIEGPPRAAVLLGLDGAYDLVRPYETGEHETDSS
jgi:transcriptional regulator with XRE-family HTH domain